MSDGEELTVVIADDDIITRKRVSAYVRSCGHKVIAEGKNGAEGLEYCRKLRPDIALFDISMPVMNGDAAAIAVKDEGLAQHVILATSQIQDATVRHLICMGIGVISKPFQQAKFTHELAAILAGKLDQVSAR